MYKDFTIYIYLKRNLNSGAETKKIQLGHTYKILKYYPTGRLN